MTHHKLTENSYIAGIDYSICSPCVAVGPLFDLSFESCQFLVLNDKKPKSRIPSNISVVPHPEYTSEIQRFDDNANLITQFCIHHKVKYAYLEDYAMGARGKVFHIGENGGILKHMMWTNHIHLHTVPPTVIKKFATGKGNAKKDGMWEQFLLDTQRNDVRDSLIGSNKLDSPVTDIVDSWYILRYAKTALEPT